MSLLTNASVLAAALLMASASSRAAEAQQDRMYDAAYGTPVDVTLDDLTLGVVSYNSRAIRTTGNLDISHVSNGSSAPAFRLREAGAWVFIVPISQRNGMLETDLLRYVGRPVTVTGLFQERGASMMTPTTSASPPEGTIRFWTMGVANPFSSVVAIPSTSSGFGENTSCSPLSQSGHCVFRG